MVDINLFKEDEEEEWKPNPDEEGEDLEGEISDNLDFDEEVVEEEPVEEEPSPLDDEDFLGDDEAIPDFDDDQEEKDLEEDYEYGEGSKKSTPIWLWIVLGVVVVVAALYIFWFMPRQNQQVSPGVSLMTPPVADSTRTAVSQPETEDVKADTGQSQDVTPPVETPATQTTTQSSSGAPASVSRFVTSALPVFEFLANQNQMGTIILEGDRFHVGYVSATQGVAQTIGRRIQGLIGATSFKTSPEDRHRTAGKIQYWGVVSGDLPKQTSSSQGSQTRFSNADQFIQSISALIRQNQLNIRQTQKFNVRGQTAPVRLKIEGARNNMVGLLNRLKGFQGRYELTKITISPVTITDFSANQVKLVLDFSIPIG